MSKPTTSDVLLNVAAPVAMVWGFIFFASWPDDLSLGDRVVGGLCFSLVFAPLMYLRVRN